MILSMTKKRYQAVYCYGVVVEETPEIKKWVEDCAWGEAQDWCEVFSSPCGRDECILAMPETIHTVQIHSHYYHLEDYLWEDFMGAWVDFVNNFNQCLPDIDISTLERGRFLFVEEV